jgi:hypothetical protein
MGRHVLLNDKKGVSLLSRSPSRHREMTDSGRQFSSRYCHLDRLHRTPSVSHRVQVRQRAFCRRRALRREATLLLFQCRPRVEAPFGGYPRRVARPIAVTGRVHGHGRRPASAAAQISGPIAHGFPACVARAGSTLERTPRFGIQIVVCETFQASGRSRTNANTPVSYSL